MAIPSAQVPLKGDPKERTAPKRKVRRPPLFLSRSTISLVGLLLLTFALRAIRLEQPIVENYVGRQIPTAMVARNLERGSGFRRPQLDTAPFPNYFLVEPPIYASAVVALRRITGLPLEPAGRLVSALAMTLGAWGLFGLVRRRDGSRVALLAVAAFAIFPVTLRYGRAFQPDALMIGLLVAALRCWDEREAGGKAFWLFLAWILLAAGLAVKIVAAYILVPLILAIQRPIRPWKVALALLALAPAVLWYNDVAETLSQGGGSRASADNRAIWLGTLIPSALLRLETFEHVVRFLVVRAFTPLGIIFAVVGLTMRGRGHRLWWTWGSSALAAMGLLAAKLHHEYYWLAAAPVVATGVGRVLALVWHRNRCLGIVASLSLLALSLFQASSTWRTPPEWATLAEGARAIRTHVPQGEWVVAPEALLFASDRRGCRLEITPTASARAAGEWGGSLDRSDPLALVEFYRSHGARYFADLATEDPSRLVLHEAIRRRYNVVVDGPGVLLAALQEIQDAPDGTR